MENIVLDTTYSVTKNPYKDINVINESISEPQIDKKLSSIPEPRKINLDEYLIWREEHQLTNVYGEKNHDALRLKF